MQQAYAQCAPKRMLMDFADSGRRGHEWDGCESNQLCRRNHIWRGAEHCAVRIQYIEDQQMTQPVSDFGRLQGVLVGVPLVKIEPQYDGKGKRTSRLLTWSTGETCLVTG